MDQSIIIQKLQKLGIQQKSSKIYLTLLQKGKLSSTQISKFTNIPKTSVYRFLGKLEHKQLVEKIVGKRGSLYKASDPQNISLLFEKVQTKYKSLASSMPAIVQSLKQFQLKPDNKTQVRYYEGKKGIEQITWNSTKASKFIYGYSRLGRARVFGQKFHENVELEYEKSNIRNLIITTNSKDTLDYLKWHKRIPVKGGGRVRYFPEDELNISNDLMLYNDILAVSSWEEEKYWGFEVQDKDFVNMQISIHKKLWKLAKPLKT